MDYKNRYGQYYSWEVKNDFLAIKKTDKSVFEHRGSGIPRQIQWFFNAENLEVGKRANITLIYDRKEYQAHIEKERLLERTRIFWKSDLSKEIGKKKDYSKLFPLLIFNKIEDKKFEIEIVTDTYSSIDPFDANKPFEEHLILSHAMDIAQLKRVAQEKSKRKTTKKEYHVKQFDRDPYISEYVKREAKGVCQLCQEKAPFEDKNGKPYLESHHIVWISKGGSDSIENQVALCPNCHRKMHILNLDEDVQRLKLKKENSHP